MIQIGNKEVDSITIGGKEVQTITIGGKVAYEKQQQINDNYFYIQNTTNGSGTISFATKGSSPVQGKYAESVEYSSDKSVWTTVNFTAGQTQTVSIPANGKLYFRNDTGVFNDSSCRTEITCDVNHNVGGDVSTLLDYRLSTAPVVERCFWCLFSDNTNLINSSDLELPATTLDRYCYSSMFSGCTNMTSVPELPATTLARACYYSMFRNCHYITKAPELPATSLAQDCYYNMFYECTRLNEITIYANSANTGQLYNWLYNVYSTGDFYNFGSATYETGNSGIPSGWTEHTSL